MQVIDTGIGISKEAQEFIFEPFRQVDETLVENIAGLGWGWRLFSN
jgi:signal transduction histidine kinase